MERLQCTDLVSADALSLVKSQCMRLVVLSLTGLLLILTSCKVTKPETVAYEPATGETIYPFVYADTVGHTYLRALRDGYGLEEVIAGASSDRERALLLTHWARERWRGHGRTVPSAGDALTILEEAESGRKFRCVEFATVASAAMAAVGMPSRRVGLKKKTVETTLGGGGHMVAEVWLADEQQWALVDGEFDLMPVLDGRALNAVAFKRALQEEQTVGFVSAAGPVKPSKQKRYLEFIERYLYYINARFDERKLAPPYQPITFTGKTQLMLVPKDAKEPTVFQRKRRMDQFVFTRSVEDFYAPPHVATRSK